MKNSPQTRQILNALLDSRDAVRYVREVADLTGVRETSVRTLFEELVELQWLATGREAQTSGHARRAIYRLTSFGVNEARAFLERRPRRNWKRSPTLAE